MEKANNTYTAVCMANSIHPAARPPSPPNINADPKPAKPMAKADRVGRLPLCRCTIVPAKAVGTIAKLLVASA